jgi:hypothetical protein
MATEYCRFKVVRCFVDRIADALAEEAKLCEARSLSAAGSLGKLPRVFPVR